MNGKFRDENNLKLILRKAPTRNETREVMYL